MQLTITKRFMRNGDLADPASVVVTEAKTAGGVVLVTPGTSFTRESEGIYSITFSIDPGVIYSYTGLATADNSSASFQGTGVAPADETFVVPADDILIDDPIEMLNVFLGAIGGAQISFLPKEDLPWPEPWSFRIEHSDNVAGTWATIATVSDTYFVTDDNRYSWNLVAENWYRVVMIDAATDEHTSRPVQIGNMWTKRDWLAARELCRKFYLACRIGQDGLNGYLLRRKQSGELCPNCGDPVTGQSTNSQCEVCYGVGITGGYYDPYPMTIMLQRSSESETDDEPTGRGLFDERSVQAVLFPWIYPRDVWVDLASGFRYAVPEKIETVDEVRNQRVIVAMTLQKIGTSDVVYDIHTPEQQLPEPN
jgi:hypothetical protein